MPPAQPIADRNQLTWNIFGRKERRPWPWRLCWLLATVDCLKYKNLHLILATNLATQTIFSPNPPNLARHVLWTCFPTKRPFVTEKPTRCENVTYFVFECAFSLLPLQAQSGTDYKRIFQYSNRYYQVYKPSFHKLIAVCTALHVEIHNTYIYIPLHTHTSHHFTSLWMYDFVKAGLEGNSLSMR